MTETAPAPARPAESYWLTRFVILRLLGAVYAVAFLVAARQILPLIGSHGLTPLNLYLGQVRDSLGSSFEGFIRLPSLFWFAHSDGFLQVTAWVGFALACVVVAGYANALMMAVLWALYMSFVHLGQDWYGYGWEIQLLETGFLGIFLCPLLDARPFPKRQTPVVVIWLFRWLIFRIMVGAALIKLRGDPCWRDLTALYYHFETQPIPGPLSRWFCFLPHWMLKIGVLFNFLAELIAPWFAFYPSIARRIAGVIIILFQVMLILSGNLSFLNWLTIVPALACFDDAFLAKCVPPILARRVTVATVSERPSVWISRTAWTLAAIIALLSIQPVTNLISPNQMMNFSLDRLDLVNTYGAFGSVGRVRLTVVFEGTDAAVPDDAAEWRPLSLLRATGGAGRASRPNRPLPATAGLANVVRGYGYTHRLSVDTAFGLETPSQRPKRVKLIWEKSFP